MVRVSDILDMMDSWAPFSDCLDFDNVGLLIGDPGAPVHKVGVALDACAETVEAAKRLGCELVVSHHPVIFHGIKHLTADTEAYRIARSGLSVISSHTNLDAADGGVNDVLAGLLGLRDTEKLACGGSTPPIARIGNIDPADARSFAAFVKERLGCDAVRLVGGGNICRVAVCGGSGIDVMPAAVSRGADALVTGECKHHDRLAAKALGLTLIEAGHFFTEHPVTAAIEAKIKQNFPQLETVILDENEVSELI